MTRIGSAPRRRVATRRDRAKPEFWLAQRPVQLAGAGILLVIIVVVIVALAH